MSNDIIHSTMTVKIGEDDCRKRTAVEKKTE